MASPTQGTEGTFLETFGSTLDYTFSTTGTDVLLFLHVGAFFGNSTPPTITSDTLTWTLLVSTGDPSGAYAGTYWAVASTAVTDEVVTATFTGSAAIGMNVEQWTDHTDYSGLTNNVDYGTGTTATDASVTTTPEVDVTTQESGSYVKGFVVGFIGEAWGAGTSTAVSTGISDYSTLERSDNPQSSTGTYTIQASNGSSNTDSWRTIGMNGYEVLGISGGGGVAGTSATTNAADISSASGNTTVLGTSATTNAADTSSASGTTEIVGSSAVTQGADTSNASGAVGSAVTGSVDVTEGADTSSASGNIEVQGSSATTNSADTSSAEGTTTVLGTLSVTEIGDTSDASGSAGNVTGTVSYTNNPDTATAVGVVPIFGGFTKEIEVVTGSSFDDLIGKNKQEQEQPKQKRKKKRKPRKRLSESVFPLITDPYLADLLARNQFTLSPIDFNAPIPQYVPESERIQMHEVDDSEMMEILMLIHEL